ncbi:MAG: mobilization protein [Alphaproteobacteria bacterium]|nr:MAG: mobilization protein [Alphaproteobacteria bacterium]
MSTPNDLQLGRLQARKAQLEAEIARRQARARVEDRKADTRRKILIGAVVMQEMKSNPYVDNWVRDLMAERLVKARDRALFGLRPLEGADGQTPPIAS